MKIRQGDTVVVISGKDKGKTGQVERVLAEDGRVVVVGINMRTRHIKKTAQQAGRKVKYEATIHASKVMLLDPKSGKPTRVGYQEKSGKKIRVAKMSGEEIKKTAPKMEKKQKTQTTQKKQKSDESSVSSAPSASSDSSAKQPFWKRMKFGAAAMEQAEVPEAANMEKDHSIPSQEMHVRKGARGS